MPKVSVIIPVFNAEKYLASALDSVLSQAFSEIEIVCVNDGSTDSSADILERYKQRDIRVKIIHQKNAGGSAARNRGMQEASSDYIMFLDSDDIYAQGVIGDSYGRATETGADIVFYNFARFVGKPTKMAVVNKTKPRHELRFLTKDTYKERLFNDFAIITWNKLIKRSVIVENRLEFDTSLSHNHDVDFAVRLMLAAQSFSWLDKVGYYYRSNDTGLTATKRSDPTNVLKILLNLNSYITTSHPSLKPSFDNYVADMIAGTVIKYSNDQNKIEEVYDFSQQKVIPELGLSGKEVSEQTGLFSIVASGDFSELIAELNSPKRKLKGFVRSVYAITQSILARIIV